MLIVMFQSEKDLCAAGNFSIWIDIWESLSGGWNLANILIKFGKCSHKLLQIGWESSTRRLNLRSQQKELFIFWSSKQKLSLLRRNILWQRILIRLIRGGVAAGFPCLLDKSIQWQEVNTVGANPIILKQDQNITDNRFLTYSWLQQQQVSTGCQQQHSLTLDAQAFV